MIAAGRWPKLQFSPESDVVTRTGFPEGLDPIATQKTRPAAAPEQLIELKDATGTRFVADVVSPEVVVMDPAVVHRLEAPLPVHAGLAIA